MYATLQEAYRIPGFDPRSKKAQKIAPAAPVEEPVTEKFENSNLGLAERITYKGQANDYKYYQQNYGLKFPEIEGFQCESSTQPAYYEIPISDESKAAYQKAMDQSMTQQKGPSTKSFVPDARTFDMNKIDGYVDEDLEKYLSTRNAPAEFPAEDNTAFAKVLRHFNMAPRQQGASSPVPMSIANPVTKTGVDNRAWDLIILVFFGILIILLCEQLFKLAMMLSMKQTVNILKPYLK